MEDSEMLTISREVFMRQGFYYFKFYNKKSKYSYDQIHDKVFGDSYYVSLPETQEVLDIILNAKKMNKKDIIKEINKYRK